MNVKEAVPCGPKEGKMTVQAFLYPYKEARFFSFNSQIIKRLLYLALSVGMDLGRSVKLLAVR